MKISESKEFATLHERFVKLFVQDFGKSADHEGIYYVYAYAMMPNNTRKTTIKGINADTLFNNCYNMYYNYNILNPKEIKFASLESKSEHSCTTINGSGYLSEIQRYVALDEIYDLHLQEQEKSNIVTQWVMHDLIHDVIGAPLDVAGDVFVAALSHHLDLDKNHRKGLWADYRYIILNSRMISQILKNNYQDYLNQIKMVNKYNLLSDLTKVTDQIISGQTIESQQIAHISRTYDICARKGVHNVYRVLNPYDRLN